MIQRLLYQRLKDGIDIILNDLSILDEIFVDMFELSQAEVDKIKIAFTQQTPNVIHGYAPTESDFPLYSIVLQSERETDTYLSDDAGMIDEPSDPDFGTDVYSSLWESTFHILCYTEHPDLTVYYYEIAKSILISSDFVSWGVIDYSMSGQDLMPDPRYIPEHLFARVLVFDGKYEFRRLGYQSKLGKAWKVRGIHVDKSGSQSDVGGVKTLVDPTSILAELTEEES